VRPGRLVQGLAARLILRDGGGRGGV
jgi:hypothetical protein